MNALTQNNSNQMNSHLIERVHLFISYLLVAAVWGETVYLWIKVVLTIVASITTIMAFMNTYKTWMRNYRTSFIVVTINHIFTFVVPKKYRHTNDQNI